MAVRAQHHVRCLRNALADRAEQRCVLSGLAELHVSIDAATPEIYERIRVRAHLDRVLDNVRRLQETKRRLGSSAPSLRMVVVAMRQNLAELPKPAEMERIAASWRPYCSVASWYLWRSLENQGAM